MPRARQLRQRFPWSWMLVFEGKVAHFRKRIFLMRRILSAFFACLNTGCSFLRPEGCGQQCLIWTYDSLRNLVKVNDRTDGLACSKSSGFGFQAFLYCQKAVLCSASRHTWIAIRFASSRILPVRFRRLAGGASSSKPSPDSFKASSPSFPAASVSSTSGAAVSGSAGAAAAEASASAFACLSVHTTLHNPR